jgi:hypothetical protein
MKFEKVSPTMAALFITRGVGVAAQAPSSDTAKVGSSDAAY